MEIYRKVVTVRFAELRIRDHVESEGFGGFWHPGIGQEGLQVGAIAALRPDGLPLLRAPRARLRARQGHGARRAVRRPVRPDERQHRRQGRRHRPLRRARSSACSARAAPSARTSCSAPAPRSRLAAARRRPRDRGLLRRRRRRARHLPRGGAPGVGVEAAGRLGLREQRLGALGADRRSRARPRTSPTAPPAYGVPGVSSTARTRSRSMRRDDRGGRARARGRGPDAHRGQDAAHPRPLRGRPAAVPRRPRPRASRSRATRSTPAAASTSRPTSADALDDRARAGGRGGVRGGARGAATRQLRRSTEDVWA